MACPDRTAPASGTITGADVAGWHRRSGRDMPLSPEKGQGLAAMFDDEEVSKPTSRVARPALEPWGIDELRAYIGELQAEIARAEAAIAAKGSHRSAADAFFRKP
jgi:uncharacterized small protein (DUF1192 family)